MQLLARAALQYREDVREARSGDMDALLFAVLQTLFGLLLLVAVPTLVVTLGYLLWRDLGWPGVLVASGCAVVARVAWRAAASDHPAWDALAAWVRTDDPEGGPSA